MTDPRSTPPQVETTPSTASPESTEPPLVTVRYWAAARQVAGVAEEKHAGRNVAAVLDAARAAHSESPRFATVVSVCSLLVGDQPLGGRDPASVAVASGDVIEVLPPFAGG